MTRRSTAVLTKKEKLPIVVTFCVFPVFLEHSPAKFDGISPDFAGISVLEIQPKLDKVRNTDGIFFVRINVPDNSLVSKYIKYEAQRSNIKMDR